MPNLLARSFQAPTLAALVCSSFAACSSEAPEATYTVRDSAGVKIVESHSPEWGGANEGWTISEEPLLQIGTRDGDEALQFFRVTDAIRISEHKFAILNAGTHTVRIVDDDGRLVTEFGGPGDGPGEFRSLSSIHRLSGDSLLVWDGRRSTASYFDIHGNFIRSEDLVAPGSTVIAGVYPGRGRGFVVQTHSGPMTHLGDRGVGVYRDPSPLLLAGEDGALRDTIGMFASNETAVMSIAGQDAVGATPFAKATQVERIGAWMIVGTADAMEVSFIDEQGNLKAIFRVLDTDLTVRDEDREWYRARMTEAAAVEMGTTPQAQQMLALVLDAMVFPETRAAYSDLKFDPSGAIWLKTGRHLPPIATSREWTVFAADTGALLGTVNLPDRFEAFEFGRDYVLGVWKDEMDVEFVRIYAIEKT